MTKKEFVEHVLPLKGKLFGYASKLLHDHESARDIVQDVMIKVWEESKPLTYYKNLEAWCVTMTRNKCLDKLKRKSNNHQRVEDRYDLANNDRQADEQIEHSDLLQHLRQLVMQLPLKQKEVLILRDYQGHSYQEIADILGVDIGQVKVTLFRARKLIKEKLLKVNSYGLQAG
jgi:RNA polymerase sigma factor (sigma-70 family)